MEKSVVIKKVTLKEASTVHGLIPEFEVDYIDKNIERLGIHHKHPYSLIATIDGRSVGYMISYDRGDVSRTMHIWLNGTIPEYRRNGVFGRLLEGTTKEAIRRGHAQITVKSDKKHFPAMVYSLQRHGFKLIEQKGDSVRYCLEVKEAN